MLTNAPKGTKDILPNQVHKWHYVENMFREACARYAYKEIRTPVFEHTELFSRGVGDTTDIVEKQMYERMLSQWMNKMVQEGISHKRVMEYVSELSMPTGWETVGYNDIGYGINYSNIKFKFRNFLLNNEVIPEQGLRRRIYSIDTDNMIHYLVDMLNEGTMQWPCRGETLEF